MATINRDQAVKKAFKLLSSKTGLTKSELVRQVKQNATNQYGTMYGEFKEGAVKLFYTDNSNFSGGLRNGYGAGIYIAITTLQGRTDIKIK